MSKAMTFSEPAPVVLKKLLVADAGWREPSRFSAYMGQASIGGQVMSEPSYPTPRDATFEDIAKALGVDAEALSAWCAIQNTKETP